MKKALISVSDKEGLDTVLGALHSHGYEFISTGGTAKYIKEAGFTAIDVAEVTGFPEMMGGRVKTLHPKIHGGLLANRDKNDHLSAADEHGIAMLDMVIVNFYPFADKLEAGFAEAIENIDIGGPSMMRSAAKNFAHVTVISDKNQYQDLISDLEEHGGETSRNFRAGLAQAAFAKSANYDALIANYLKMSTQDTSTTADKAQDSPLKDSLKSLSSLTFKQSLRYGENPHQKAALFALGDSGLANAEQLQGKELSFNNFLDLDTAWNIVTEFDSSVPCVSIIKHSNPCGVAIAPSVKQAYQEALICDMTSAFGGIVASNRTIDLDAANEMTQIFLEAIIAPDFSEEALKILSSKKNLRVLKIKKTAANQEALSQDIKSISGGVLIQDKNEFLVKPDSIKTVSKKAVTEEQWIDLLFAWKVVKHVKSNAIVVVKDGRTLGIGVGQTNRVGALELAVKNMDIDSRGAVLASDAFFPFKDSIELAAQNHISAIIQPGGSIKDEEVIEASDDLGIAMVFTGSRHFRH